MTYGGWRVADLQLNIGSDSAAARRSLDATARALDNLADQTSQLGRRFVYAAGAAGRAAGQIEDVGDEARRTARAVDDLGDETGQAAAKAIAAGLAYRDLDGKLRDVHGRFLSVAKAQKLLGAPGGGGDKPFDFPGEAARGGVKAASTFAAAFQGGLMKLLKTPAGMFTAGAVAVPAVIGAGALAGGAVTAGVGTGVVGAGIAGAASGSQRVQREWDDTTAHIKARFLDATTSFEGPTIAAIGKIEDAIDDVDMEKIFGNAAELLEPIAEGTAIAIRTLGGSVEYVTERAGPAMEALGGAIAEIASGIDIAMREIADGSEGGAEAIQDFGHGIAMLIAGGGKFIGWLEDAYAALDDFTQALGDVYPPLDALQDFWGVSDDTVTVLTELSRGTVYAADSMRVMGQETYNTADAADAANEAFDRLFGEMMSVDEANLAVKQGFADLKEELLDGKRTLDGNTQAGRDNIAAVLDQISVLNQQREATIAAGNGTKEATDAANAAYASQVAAIRRLLVELGYPPAAIDAIIGKYEDLARMPNITKTVRILTYEQAVSGKGGQGQSRGSGFASGTMSAPPGWAWTGEEGPELVNFRGGERVLTAAQSARMVAGASNGPSGGGTVRHVVDLMLGGQLLRTIIINEATAQGRTVAQYLGI